MSGRLRALSRFQSLLATDHQEVDLRELVTAELAAHGDGGLNDKVRIDGPEVALPAPSAQAVGLALHELSTNAVKYGALAQPAGRLQISWREEIGEGNRRIVLEWAESGVAMPEGTRPARKGYGSHLIERALAYQLGAQTRLEFGGDGVRCTVAVPVKRKIVEAAHG
jgi:two-component sensor histidine kinase